MLRNGGVEDNQGFGVVVHPPLGKQLIAIGEWLLGYTPTGWRLASAVAGIVCILLIIRVVRRMTRSTLLGGIAGVLLICDGVSHVQSRSALLDIFQAVFVLGAFACLVADRDQVRARLAASVGAADRSARTHWAGIALGARWWRFGAGVLLGLTTAVKWSGAYWIVAFGVLSVIWDITARRQAGIRRPVRAVVRRDLLPNLWALGRRPDADLHRSAGGPGSRPKPSWPRHTLVAVASNRGGLEERGAVRPRVAVVEHAVAVDLEDARLPFPPADPDRPGAAAPLGIQAVDLADRHPAGAVLLPGQRRRLRRRPHRLRAAGSS